MQQHSLSLMLIYQPLFYEKLEQPSLQIFKLLVLQQFSVEPELTSSLYEQMLFAFEQLAPTLQVLKQTLVLNLQFLKQQLFLIYERYWFL